MDIVSESARKRPGFAEEISKDLIYLQLQLNKLLFVIKVVDVNNLISFIAIQWFRIIALPYRPFLRDILGDILSDISENTYCCTSY